jgi:hypothetical protein
LKRLLIAGLVLYAICNLAGQTQNASPGLTITPPKVDFGRQALNSSGPPVTVTVSNLTSSPIAIEEIITSGIDFPSRNGCEKQLAPAAQCSIEITFRPVITGDRMGLLEVTASDSANSHFVPLTGIGVDLQGAGKTLRNDVGIPIGGNRR